MELTAYGILYLVATPIGNLGDLSFRAVDILSQVALIACEDTRHSRPLLLHHGISTPLWALHEHNEDHAAATLVERLLKGESIALISDAGTPLINDPGYPLVQAAIKKGIRVVPVPGACALIAALSASGLPTHRFSFEGFPPRKSAARKATLKTLLDYQGTLVFYESSHRVMAFIQDIAMVFPANRTLVIARELTKRFETLARTCVADGVGLLEQDPDMQRGEFVILLEGAPERSHQEQLDVDVQRMLALLLEECPLRTAVSLTVKISGAKKDDVYREALKLKTEADGGQGVETGG